MTVWESIAHDIAVIGSTSKENWVAFAAYVHDKSVSVDERLSVMRPYAVTDPNDVHGHMQEWYEEALCELPDGDPRITEFYDLFGVN